MLTAAPRYEDDEDDEDDAEEDEEEYDDEVDGPCEEEKNGTPGKSASNMRCLLLPSPGKLGMMHLVATGRS